FKHRRCLVPADGSAVTAPTLQTHVDGSPTRWPRILIEGRGCVCFGKESLRRRNRPPPENVSKLRQRLETEARMPKMLILRGNSGPNYPDESGTPHNYERGALHEQAAVEYARRKGYEGIVLDISGDPDARPGKTRATSPQTLLALTTLVADDSITGLYGFSGGGYLVCRLLLEKKTHNANRLNMSVSS